MSAGPDLTVIAIALGVLAAIACWGWLTLAHVRRLAGDLRRFADARAERQRAGIAADRAPESLARRAGQILSLTALVAILAYAVFRKFSLL